MTNIASSHCTSSVHFGGLSCIWSLYRHQCCRILDLRWLGAASLHIADGLAEAVREAGTAITTRMELCATAVLL